MGSAGVQVECPDAVLTPIRASEFQNVFHVGQRLASCFVFRINVEGLFEALEGFAVAFQRPPGVSCSSKMTNQPKDHELA